jgi:RNA polymerase sigma factor (sigma-70 family)
MDGIIDEKARCLEFVGKLNEEQGWNLSADEQRAYAAGVYVHLPKGSTDDVLRKLIGYYHTEHEVVHALLDRDHHGYEARWKEWTTTAVAILQQARLGWSADSTTTGEDLAQVALAQLLQSLPSFHYTSRFSTWAYSVITRSVRRYLRDQSAGKRAGNPLSLDQHPQLDVMQREAEHPEVAATAHSLITLIDAVLTDRAGDRLAYIYRLWAIRDMRPEQIGKLVQLSPSRVRMLLAQARELLQAHPALQAWREPETRRIEVAGAGNN